MILFRFGVWGTKSGRQLQKLCNFEKGPWSLCTTWYGVPAFLAAALLTTMCIDFLKNEKGNVQILCNFASGLKCSI